MSRDSAHVEDIRLAAARVRSCIEGMNRAEFLADDKTKAAVAREITIIGESAGRTSETYRTDHSEIPWDRLIRLRHLYIHVDEQDAANEDRGIDEIVDAGISFLLRNAEMSDAEATEKLKQFVDQRYAGPLVRWIPIAFGRKLYGSATFSESYVFVEVRRGTPLQGLQVPEPIVRIDGRYFGSTSPLSEDRTSVSADV